MSEESNTTSGTNPKPREQAAQGSPGAPGTGAFPRLSFKKRAEDAATPENVPHTPLKRPPPGAKLVPSGEASPTSAGETAANSAPGKRGTTAVPFDAHTKPPARRNLAMMIGLVVLLVVAAGEAYVIFMMHDQNTVAENSAKPPMVVNTAPKEKPLEVINNGAPSPTPAYNFLLTFSPQIASGNEPRLFVSDKIFRIGDIVDSAQGLKWVGINDQARELEFVDKAGRHYIKKF